MPPLDVDYRAKKAEDAKKKWVDRKDGKEYVFVRCETCGQPHARQEVLRIPAADIALWQRAEQERYRKVVRLERSWILICLILVFGVAGTCGYVAYLAQKDIVSGFLIGMAVSTLPLWWTMRNFYVPQGHLAQAKKEEAQKDILARAGIKIEPGEIGTLGDAYPCKYVLIASETT
jgi:hypothetical protein